MWMIFLNGYRITCSHVTVIFILIEFHSDTESRAAGENNADSDMMTSCEYVMLIALRIKMMKKKVKKKKRYAGKLGHFVLEREIFNKCV